MYLITPVSRHFGAAFFKCPPFRNSLFRITLKSRNAIVLLLFLIASVVQAQEDSPVINYENSKHIEQKITEDDLSKYKEDKAFNYVEIEQSDSFIGRFIKWLENILQNFFEAIFGVGKASGIIYFIFNIFPYLILALLLFFLVKFFLKVNSRHVISGRQNLATITFTEDEHIIKNENINTLINNAIKQKNFRLAIRYYYLLSLRLLSKHHLISWKQQKTNEDYITEIKTKAVKSGFKTITRIYDYVWYGEFPIDELKFETLKSAFETLNTTIKRSE